jgi:hypothetical protein
LSPSAGRQSKLLCILILGFAAADSASVATEARLANLRGAPKCRASVELDLLPCGRAMPDTPTASIIWIAEEPAVRDESAIFFMGIHFLRGTGRPPGWTPQEGAFDGFRTLQ